MAETLCSLFLCFFLFAFIGWVVETLLYVLRDRKAVKRGFLFGPVCPIYGAGAMIATAIYYTGITKPFYIFLFGMILCGWVEYVTHFVMEKAFNAMWWDYTGRMFNINGRVYLKGLLFFGAGILIMVKFMLPHIYFALSIMPHWFLYLLTLVIYTIFVVDVTTTIADLAGTVKSLKKFMNSTINKSQEVIDDTEKVIVTNVDKGKEKIKEFQSANTIINSMKPQYSVLDRIKKKYPNFSLKKYKDELNWYFGPDDEGAKDGIELHGAGNIKLDEDDKNGTDE